MRCRVGASPRQRVDLVDLTADRHMLSHATRVALCKRLMPLAEAARRYALAFAEND